MDSQDCTVTQASTAAQAASNTFSSTYTPHTLASLPNDVLLQVWTHLDDPVPLSRVNKRFYRLSQDTLWRAKWLMQRYELYLVIFEAIARPKLFTPALLERLLRLGAPLSRNLVQILLLVRNGKVVDSIWDPIRWGGISSSAYTAVKQQAALVHGQKINAKAKELDSRIFEWWRDFRNRRIEEEKWEQGKLRELRDNVRRLFHDQSFMPLPLTVDFIGEDRSRVLRAQSPVLAALVGDSELVPFVLRSGYVLTNERTEELLNRWSQRQSAERAISSAERLLEANKVVDISQDYARQVFGPPPTPTESSGWHVEREVLLHLNQKFALPFRLEDVIPDFPASVPAIEDE